MKDVIDLFGLFLSSLGSVLLALAVFKNPDGAHGFKKGKKIYFASIDLNMFRSGVWVLVSGLVIQLIDKLVTMLII